MSVFFHTGIGQANSGVAKLITNYQSDSSRAVTGREVGHQGTDAYKVILSGLAQAIQTTEQGVAASASGLDVYNK
jgi:hypothetical protein